VPFQIGAPVNAWRQLPLTGGCSKQTWLWPQRNPPRLKPARWPVRLFRSWT